MEIWKEIKDYNGRYDVSNYGNVRSNIGTKKILNLNKTKLGYLFVLLSTYKNPKFHYVHRLVAIHFIDNPHNKETVNHKDGNKTNNNANNLEWKTQKENVIHSYKIGLSNTAENRPEAKLKNKDVIEIRKRIDFGFKDSEIAYIFGVSITIVRNIRIDKTYKSVK